MYLHELKAHRKSIIIWVVSIVLLIAMSANKYNTISSSGQIDSVGEMMKDMPRAIKAMFGGDLNLATTAGYYGVCFVFVVVMAAIHAALLGTNIIAKEETEKTVEFLFSKPITRVQALTSKFLAALTNIVIFNLASFGIGLWFFGAYPSDTFSTGDLVLLHVGLFLTQLIFLTIGHAIAAWYKDSRKASNMAMAVVLATYLLSIMVAFSEKIDFLKYLSPFKYFEVEPLVNGRSWDLTFYFLAAIIIFGCIAITLQFYKKRDLTV